MSRECSWWSYNTKTQFLNDCKRVCDSGNFCKDHTCKRPGCYIGKSSIYDFCKLHGQNNIFRCNHSSKNGICMNWTLPGKKDCYYHILKKQNECESPVHPEDIKEKKLLKISNQKVVIKKETIIEPTRFTLNFLINENMIKNYMYVQEHTITPLRLKYIGDTGKIEIKHPEEVYSEEVYNNTTFNLTKDEYIFIYSYEEVTPYYRIYFLNEKNMNKYREEILKESNGRLSLFNYMLYFELTEPKSKEHLFQNII